MKRGPALRLKWILVFGMIGFGCFLYITLSWPTENSQSETFPESQLISTDKTTAPPATDATADPTVKPLREAK